jgi:large subunit ribosomal protein L24
MRISKCHIKKDDKVKIIVGKDKGKISKVLKVLKKENRLIIENVNIVKRHTKAGVQKKESGIIQIEAPIHWSNVMLVCNKCVAPSRLRMRRLEDGRKVRVCTKCGDILDL